MNTAIVLLVVCAAAVEVLAGPHGHGGGPGSHGEKMKQYMGECIESTGVDRESLKAVKNGGSAPDQKVKCFQACMGTKMGLMNEDGTVNKDKFNQVPPHIPEERKEEITQAMSKCSEKKGTDKCDTAWLIWECLRPLVKPQHRRQSKE